ncbi:MAG: HD domain-containing protein [Lachnospiraceae bacterium]
MGQNSNSRETQIYDRIRENEEVQELIRKGNENLGILGYTDHGPAHVGLVAKRGEEILEKFGYPEHDVQLVKIAGYLHDIGNAVNRHHHAEFGAMLANDILREQTPSDNRQGVSLPGEGLSITDRVTILSAIAHHDESTGGACDPVSAALIIADKTDVRRNRVRPKPKASFDIHDRVNYAVTCSELKIDSEQHILTLNLTVDESICTMYEYFDIFLGRMLMCRGAAEILEAAFKLVVNGSKVL